MANPESRVTCPSGFLGSYTFDDGDFSARSSYYDALIKLTNSQEFTALVGQTSVGPLFEVAGTGKDAILTVFTPEQIANLARIGT